MKFYILSVLLCFSAFSQSELGGVLENKSSGNLLVLECDMLAKDGICETFSFHELPPKDAMVRGVVLNDESVSFDELRTFPKKFQKEIDHLVTQKGRVKKVSDRRFRRLVAIIEEL